MGHSVHPFLGFGKTEKANWRRGSRRVLLGDLQAFPAKVKRLAMQPIPRLAKLTRSASNRWSFSNATYILPLIRRTRRLSGSLHIMQSVRLATAAAVSFDRMLMSPHFGLQ